MRWTEVPDAVRATVTAHLGPITDVQDITVGSSSDLAVVITSDSGEEVFVKAVGGISPRMRWLRNEIIGNAAARTLAPAMLFDVDLDADGTPWLVVGTEFIDGRPVSLAPGSPDLDIVGATLEAIAAIRAPVEVWPLTRRWAPTDWWYRCAEHSPTEVAGWDLESMTRLCAPVPRLVDGDRLVHTDLHSDQILLPPGGQARVIDWGYPGSGALWVDSALMILRLIIAGHDRADAEAWGRTLPMLADLDAATLDAFAVYIAGLWTHFAHTRPLPGSARWARVAREWAAWRLDHHRPLLAH